MLTSNIQYLEKRLSAIENCLQLYSNWEVATPPNLHNHLSQNDRLFRHCSTITNLYALWEKFVKDALSSWLTLIPRYRRFDQLTENFRNKYRLSMGTLLRDISRREFRHLRLQSVIQAYHGALQGGGTWAFVTDALTMHESNIRKEQLVQLFSSIDIPDIWHEIENDFEVKAQRDSIDGSVNAENLLNDFVNYRNDSSHGDPEELLGPDILRQWICFIRAICNALNRSLTLRALHYERECRPDNVYGVVLNKYRGNVAILRLISGKRIRVGDAFHFYRPNSFKIAQILSIQINGESTNEYVAALTDVEVGLGLSVEVQDNAEMLHVDF